MFPQINNETLTIDSSLGQSLNWLMNECYGNIPIIINDAQLTNKDEAGKWIEVEGISSFLNYANIPVTARLELDTNGNIQLLIKYLLIDATPSVNGWKFSAGFPDLPATPSYIDILTTDYTSPLDDLDLYDAFFVVTSIKRDDNEFDITLNKGINFVSQMNPNGLLGIFKESLGGSKCILYGTITLPKNSSEIESLGIFQYPWTLRNPVPGICLQANLGIELSLYNNKLSNVLFHIYSPTSTKWLDKNQSYKPIVCFEVTLEIPSADVHLDISACLSPGSKNLFFRGDFENVVVTNLANLVDIAGTKDLISFMPEQIKDAADKLGEIKLQSAAAIISFINGSYNLVSTHFTLGFPEFDWHIWNDHLTVSNISCGFSIHQPFQSPRTSVNVLGTLILENVPFSVSANTIGDFAVSAELIDNHTIPLQELMRAYAPSIPAPGNLAVTAMQMYIVPGKFYDMTMAVASKPDAWIIPLGPKGLEINDISLNINLVAGGSLKGNFLGTASFGNASFRVSWNLPGEFKISGTLPKISFKTLITELCGNISPFKELFSNNFDLVLDNTEICIQKDDTRSTASFATQVAGFGTMILYVQSNPTAVVVAFDLPDEWKLSSLGLPKDFDGISFSQNLLMISSLDDPSFELPGLDLFASANLPGTFQAIPRNQGVKKGLDFHSNIALDQDMFDEVMDWLKLSEDLSLPVNIRIGVDPFSAELAAKLSEDSPIDISGIKLTNPQLQMGVGMTNPYFGVGATVEMNLNGQNIQVLGNIDVEENGAKLEAIFKGTLAWNDIFGIPAKVSTTNPTVVFGFSFQGMPTLGLSGDFQIDQLAGNLAISLNSINPAQSMLSGTLDQIKLDGLVSTFCKSGVQIPGELADVLNQSSLSNVNIYIAPTDTTIGEEDYKAGFKFSGTLDIMGLSTSVNVDLDPGKGVDFNADMDGPLAIGGVLVLSGDEGKAGPNIAICTYPDNPKFAFSGLAIVSGLFSVAADVSISNGACSFLVDADVFNYFKLHIDAENIKISDLSTFNCDLTLMINVDQINALIANVLNNIHLAASDTKSAADQAKKNLDNANTSLDSVYDSITKGMQNAITNKQNQINANNTTINNYKKTGDRRYGHYVRYVRRNGYWTYTRNRWGWRIPRWVGPQYGSRWEIFVWITTSIKALGISNNSLATDIKNLNSNIKLVKTVGTFLAQASKDAINAARSGVSTATEAYNQATAAINKDLAKAANWITSNSGNLLEINSITIDTKLGDLMSSSFKASVDYTLIQRNKDTLSVQLDINKIEDFTTAVTNNLIGEVKKLF